MTAIDTTTAGTAAGQPVTRRTGLIALGIVLVVVGLVAAVGLWVVAGNRLDDSVQGLARAPVGCDTTLDFSETGEFFLFVETRGEIEGVRGDCEIEGTYSIDGEAPSVLLSMLDPDGVEVDLDPASGIDYDAAGFAGQSVSVASVTTTGDHVLRVESDPDAELFAVAVGKDPSDGVGLLRVGAIAAALVGLTAGIICIVFGARRRQPAAVAATWPATSAAWPQSPEGATPPTWGGSGGPAVGPPQGWPSQPPAAPPTPTAPPGSQQPGGYPPSTSPSPGYPPSGQAPTSHPPSAGSSPGFAPGAHPPTSQPPTSTPPSTGSGWGPGAPDPGGQRPTLPGQPTLPGSPGADDTSSTGDGERSPWAPPGDD